MCNTITDLNLVPNHDPAYYFNIKMTEIVDTTIDETLCISKFGIYLKKLTRSVQKKIQIILSLKMFKSYIYIHRHLLLLLYANHNKIILKFKNWINNNKKQITEVLYFLSLKLVSAIFLSKFYISLNDSPSKNMKNVFYFMAIAFFVLEIFKFLYFHLPLFFSLSVIALEVDPR